MPVLLGARSRVDFGAGFYLTSDFEQAKSWARTKVNRAKTGIAQVSSFEIDDEKFTELKIKTFKKANVSWLRYIAANRLDLPRKPETADVVIGPVANDQTAPTLALYLSGTYTEQEAIRRLKTQHLKDQFLFRTEAALALLSFKEVVQV